MHDELLLLSRLVRYSERQAGGQAGWTASLGEAIMRIHTRSRSIKWLGLVPAAVLAMGCAEMGANGTAPARADPKQNFITAANFACLTLSLKQDRSVKCLLNYHDSKPVLQITFEGTDRNKIQEKINTYGPLVLSMVGPDLCAAAGSGFGAELTLIDAKSHQTARYSCQQQRFTSWVQVAGTTGQ